MKFAMNFVSDDKDHSNSFLLSHGTQILMLNSARDKNLVPTKATGRDQIPFVALKNVNRWVSSMNST